MYSLHMYNVFHNIRGTIIKHLVRNMYFSSMLMETFSVQEEEEEEDEDYF